MPITPANITQVDELFQRIVEGEHQLDPALVLQIQKLRKGASKAIADSIIQRTTNVKLITAKITKKKQLNRQKGKNYGFGRVLNAETLREREGFCLFQEYWAHLSRCQPNLLGVVKKKKKALSPAKTPARSASPSKKLAVGMLTGLDWATGLDQATGLAINQAIDLISPRKPAVPKKSVIPKKPATPTRKLAMPKKPALPRKVTEHAQNVVKAVEQVVPTRSGRKPVKKVIFEAGKN